MAAWCVGRGPIPAPHRLRHTSPRANPPITSGVEASNPTTSSMPGSSGSAIVKSQASYPLDDPGPVYDNFLRCSSSLSVVGIGVLRMSPAGSRGPNQRSIERRPPHALRHLCESSPAAPGLSRSAPERTRTSPLLLPTWEGVDFQALQQRRATVRIALISGQVSDQQFARPAPSAG